MRPRTSGATSCSHPEMWYGGLSGGTTPLTSSITKKGAPSTAGSVSYQRTAGTGIAVLAARVVRTVCWTSNAASGNSVYPVGATRTTQVARCGVPPERQLPSTIRVSFEKPVAPGPRKADSSTSPSASTLGASQAANCLADRSTSRCAGIGTVDSLVGVGRT